MQFPYLDAFSACCIRQIVKCVSLMQQDFSRATVILILIAAGKRELKEKPTLPRPSKRFKIKIFRKIKLGRAVVPARVSSVTDERHDNRLSLSSS